MPGCPLPEPARASCSFIRIFKQSSISSRHTLAAAGQRDVEGAHSTSALAGRLFVLFMLIPTLCSPGHGRTDVAASFKSRPISETRMALRQRVLAPGGTLSRPWPWGRVDPRFGRKASVGPPWPRRMAPPRANSTLDLPHTPSQPRRLALEPEHSAQAAKNYHAPQNCMQPPRDART